MTRKIIIAACCVSMYTYGFDAEFKYKIPLLGYKDFHRIELNFGHVIDIGKFFLRPSLSFEAGFYVFNDGRLDAIIDDENPEAKISAKIPITAILKDGKEGRKYDIKFHRKMPIKKVFNMSNVYDMHAVISLGYYLPHNILLHIDGIMGFGYREFVYKNRSNYAVHLYNNSFLNYKNFLQDKMNEGEMNEMHYPAWIDYVNSALEKSGNHQTLVYHMEAANIKMSADDTPSSEPSGGSDGKPAEKSVKPPKKPAPKKPKRPEISKDKDGKIQMDKTKEYYTSGNNALKAVLMPYALSISVLNREYKGKTGYPMKLVQKSAKTFVGRFGLGLGLKYKMQDITFGMDISYIAQMQIANFKPSGLNHPVYLSGFADGDNTKDGMLMTFTSDTVLKNLNLSDIKAWNDAGIKSHKYGIKTTKIKGKDIKLVYKITSDGKALHELPFGIVYKREIYNKDTKKKETKDAIHILSNPDLFNTINTKIKMHRGAKLEYNIDDIIPFIKAQSDMIDKLYNNMGYNHSIFMSASLGIKF